MPRGDTIVRNDNLYPEQGFADPHALVDGDKVYLFCGHDQSWYTNHTWVMDKWVIISSDNLKDWTIEGEILPTDTYIGNKAQCWAGFISKKDNRYYWYFSNRNIDIGVMVAEHPWGPFVDVLGKPLLDEHSVEGIEVYDPCVFEENGIYTMIFGKGTYYAIELGQDMVSTLGQARALTVVDKEGFKVMTDDKSTLFKRNGLYYLAWGNAYAISDTLYGNYVYQGKFVHGGHNSYFEWKGQAYAAHEHGDISFMYRGIAIKPLFFNEDHTLNYQRTNEPFKKGHLWHFNQSSMGWKALNGTTLTYHNGSIKGTVTGDALIQSAIWLDVDLTDYHELHIDLQNLTSAKSAQVYIAPADYTSGFFWEHPQVDLDELRVMPINLKPYHKSYQHFTINLADFMDTHCGLKCICIKPAIGAVQGEWSIRRIEIK